MRIVDVWMQQLNALHKCTQSGHVTDRRGGGGGHVDRRE